MVEDNLAQDEESNGDKVEGDRGHHHLEAFEGSYLTGMIGQEGEPRGRRVGTVNKHEYDGEDHDSYDRTGKGTALKKKSWCFLF